MTQKQTPEEKRIAREERRQKRIRRKRRRIVAVIVTAAAVAVCVLVVWNCFPLKKIRVSGSSLYPAAKVEQTMKKDDSSGNTLLLYLKYSGGEWEKTLPYLKDMQISMTDPGTLSVRVSEKKAVGYLYDSGIKKNIYFSDDGQVLRITGKKIGRHVRIAGLHPGRISLYGTMNLKEGEKNRLTTAQSILSMLEDYDIMPQTLYLKSDGMYLLDYGKVQVNLGTGTYLNEKIVRAAEIMKKIRHMKGTLHLETWTESTTDIYFRKKELTKIPQ